jgi:hypothetical protein
MIKGMVTYGSNVLSVIYYPAAGSLLGIKEV